MHVFSRPKHVAKPILGPRCRGTPFAAILSGRTFPAEVCVVPDKDDPHSDPNGPFSAHERSTAVT